MKTGDGEKDRDRENRNVQATDKEERERGREREREVGGAESVLPLFGYDRSKCSTGSVNCRREIRG